MSAEIQYSNDPKRIRERLRRGTLDPDEGRRLLGGKPIDEWDLDELARGRPRNPDGTFKGWTPTWVTPALKEEAYTRFREYVRGELAGGSLRALARIKDLVDDGDSDRVKLDAAKWMLEYLLGKPTQEIKGDLTMNIQSLLAGALVNPEVDIIDVEAEEDDFDYDEDDEDDD